MGVVVYSLRWADVGPFRRQIDLNAVRRTVKSVFTAVRSRGADARARQDAVDRALLAEHGSAIAGWRWARSEPGGGGPVTAYCCADHSLGNGASADTEVVVAAVADWAGWLMNNARDWLTKSSDWPTGTT